MVWFRIDDTLPFHERVIRAGNAAIGLWVRAGAWSAGQLTDGFIPADVARTMGTAAEIRRLVDVGLWLPETKDDVVGYVFHRWAEDGTGQKRQPTRAEVEEQRRAERDRKAAWRASRKDGKPTPASVPASVPAGHLPDVRQASEYPDPTRPDLPLLTTFEGGAPPVDNSGEDREPPLRCPAHLGVARPPKCGPCKDARLEHEAWTLRQTTPIPAPRPPAWDPTTHCEHGQLLGDCDACAYEARQAGTVIRGRFGNAS